MMYLGIGILSLSYLELWFLKLIIYYILLVQKVFSHNLLTAFLPFLSSSSGTTYNVNISMLDVVEMSLIFIKNKTKHFFPFAVFIGWFSLLIFPDHLGILL